MTGTRSGIRRGKQRVVIFFLLSCLLFGELPRGASGAQEKDEWFQQRTKQTNKEAIFKAAADTRKIHFEHIDATRRTFRLDATEDTARAKSKMAPAAAGFESSDIPLITNAPIAELIDEPSTPADSAFGLFAGRRIRIKPVVITRRRRRRASSPARPENSDDERPSAAAGEATRSTTSVPARNSLRAAHFSAHDPAATATFKNYSTQEIENDTTSTSATERTIAHTTRTTIRTTTRTPRTLGTTTRIPTTTVELPPITLSTRLTAPTLPTERTTVRTILTEKTTKAARITTQASDKSIPRKTHRNLEGLVDLSPTLYPILATTLESLKVRSRYSDENQLGFPWPVKKEAVVEGDIVLGGLMMVHEREDSITCGPVMPQGGIQALEAMLYTLDQLNDPVQGQGQFLPNITLGAHILDDCDKDTYGLEMAVDFIKEFVFSAGGGGVPPPTVLLPPQCAAAPVFSAANAFVVAGRFLSQETDAQYSQFRHILKIILKIIFLVLATTLLKYMVRINL